MIELNQLEQLITIAKEGTISKASEKLLISQPAITRSIQKLEEELGISLFDRTKNKVTLNDNGELAVSLANDLLKEANLMIEKLKAHDQSKFKISIGSCAPAPIWVLSSIFEKEVPEILLESEILSDEETLISGLKNEQYSIIIINKSLDLGNDILMTEIFEEQLYLSLPPAHPLASYSTISFDEINGESILLLSRIGFWGDICKNMIPDSELLFQDSETAFNSIKNASALPTFRTNITIEREKNKENRNYVPITDIEAKVKFYVYYLKKNAFRFDYIEDNIKNMTL